jgi:hypothetical protein
MEYIVSPVRNGDNGPCFSIPLHTKPARFVNFSFADDETAGEMAARMKEILEVCVSVTAPS